MSLLNVNKVDPATGTGLELGSSGDTITIPSGATITNNGTANNFGSEFAVTQYTARLFKAASQSISNASHTKITLTTEVFDKGGIADESNSKITIPSGGDGLWLFRGVVRGDDIRANRFIVNLYKNGSTLDGTTAGDIGEISTKGSDSYTGASVVTMGYLNLSASDYIEMYCYQNQGSTKDVQQCSLSCVYLGAIS